MIRFFFDLHWWVAWLILVVGMSAMVRYVRGYLRGADWSDLDSRLGKALRSLLSLQGALGFIFFLSSGLAGSGFPIRHVAHGVVMMFAIGVAHLSARWAKTDDQTRFLNNFFAILTSFILMLVALSILTV